jgi:hypothetical protein
LTVTAPPPPPPPNPILNGGFETGTLADWISSGTTGIGNSGCHSGLYCAQVGAATATSGTSSIAQTFKAPSGATLSFYYRGACPDRTRYAWATATLRDNTNNTTNMVLPRTCTNSGSWVKVSSSVTANHSYTITLSSHDDGDAVDANYTVYDDVSVQ